MKALIHRPVIPAFCLSMLVIVGIGHADTLDESVLPDAPDASTFKVLIDSSPFRRNVSPADHLILTGVARIEEEVVATLLDTESSEIHLVSRRANPRGWQLVDMSGNEADLESLTAKIQIEGGQLVSIRYEKAPKRKPTKSVGRSGGSSGSSSGKLSSDQLREAKEAAMDPKKGFSGDGLGKISGDMLKKISQLSVKQRETINRQMLELRNKGLGTEQRRKIYTEKINSGLRGR